MPQQSAGLLMCRFNNSELEFFLIHPGGPFYAKKDKGVWSIPKGLLDDGEDSLAAAQREFAEETGIIPAGDFHSIGSVKMKSGKIIQAWTFIGKWNEQDGIKSNFFALQWPPNSGKIINVPEADSARWMNFETALEHVIPVQIPFLERARNFYT
jgi:predicted NUDIX family NTP pyrophosphohydrolase